MSNGWWYPKVAHCFQVIFPGVSINKKALKLSIMKLVQGSQEVSRIKISKRPSAHYFFFPYCSWLTAFGAWRKKAMRVMAYFIFSPMPPLLQWPWASLICIVMEIGIKPGKAQASCCTRWQNLVIFLLGGQRDYNLFEDLSATCDNRSPNINRQLWELKMSKTFVRGFLPHAHTKKKKKSSVFHHTVAWSRKRKSDFYVVVIAPNTGIHAGVFSLDYKTE